MDPGLRSAWLHSAIMGDPWEIARAAAEAAGVTLRALSDADDGAAVNAVIERTWGGQRMDHEVVRALGFSGNIVWGAESAGELVGFALGWAGVDEYGLHVHSHMVAAIPDRRHSGVGYSLKLAQRAAALDQGITIMRWTFDPMIARNAWFNLGKLGTVADRFYPDFYGVMTDDLNAGDRSDRLVARWDLAREPGPRSAGEGATAILVPAEYADLRASDPAAAANERDRVRGAIEAAFSQGCVAVAFDRAASAYLLAPEEGGS